MKKLLLIACLAFTTASIAQNDTNPWVEIEENDGIKISMRYADCDMAIGFDEKRVLLKFENTRTSSAAIEWDTEMYFDGNCHYCDDLSESRNRLELQAGEMVQGSCERGKDFELFLVVKLLGTEGKTLTPVETMSDFKLLNINVTKL